MEQIKINITRSAHALASKKAKSSGKSISQWISEAIEAHAHSNAEMRQIASQISRLRSMLDDDMHKPRKQDAKKVPAPVSARPVQEESSEADIIHKEYEEKFKAMNEARAAGRHEEEKKLEAEVIELVKRLNAQSEKAKREADK